MPISTDFLKIINEISNVIELPSITDIIIPLVDNEAKKSNFSAIVLEDNTIGLFYINLNPIVKERFKDEELIKYRNSSLKNLVNLFKSHDLFEKSLALGAINAISQFLFKKAQFLFDFTTDSLGLLNIKRSDTIGMVGFFPPLIRLIEDIGSNLIIIEKKEDLIQKSKNWIITLDPSKLEQCNKVLITGTTVLNETLDEILTYCVNSEKTSVIGPTASFLPDPLFERQIDVVGGSCIINPSAIIKEIQTSRKWSSSVKKYTIGRISYPGYAHLLSKICE